MSWGNARCVRVLVLYNDLMGGKEYVYIVKHTLYIRLNCAKDESERLLLCMFLQGKGKR